MEYMGVIVILLATVIVMPTIINGDKNEREQTVNTESPKEKWMTALWLEGPKNNKTLTINTTESAFNDAFSKCGIVRGFRSVYVRTTPIPASFNAYRIFAQTWADHPNNKLNQDFQLFDNFSDSLPVTGKWSSCNYNDAGVGFPRDCGKKSAVGGFSFFALPGSRYFSSIPSNQGIEIFTGENCGGVVEEFLMGKTTWGSFVDPIFCERGSRVSGFRLRVQAKQGIIGDDSALNGIQLACTNGKVTQQIVGVFGDWKEWVYCGGKLQNDSSKFVVGFNFRSESDQGMFGDDTAGTNVKVQCNDGSELDGGGQDWGTWHSETDRKCAFEFYLCGVQSRIQPDQGKGDNTGMNQIKFICCGKELANLAAGKAANQSSTWIFFTKAESAVDGNLNTWSETKTPISWWRVDLGKPAIIYKVRVYTYWFEWLTNTTIAIGNNVNGGNMTSCGTFTREGGKARGDGGTARGEGVTARGEGCPAYDVICETHVVGRYMQVNKNSDNYWNLLMREVQAYGRYIN